MRISAKIDYACRALLELSMHWPNNIPVQIGTIARNQDIPIKFLTQILLHLKQIGYVQSTRGKKGGYLLSIAPKKIQLNEVVEQLGGIGYSITENRNNSQSEHVMDLVWSDVDKAVLKTMAEIDFEQISDRKRSRDKAFVFQI